MNLKAETKNTIKAFFRNILVWLVFSFFVFFFILYSINPQIEREILFWFLSTICQSMAAMFAVIGMFAIFRYQSLNDRIRKEVEYLRERLEATDLDVITYDLEIEGLTDEYLIEILSERMESPQGKILKEGNPRLHNNIEVSILVNKLNIGVRESIRRFAIIPMIFMLFTLSISSVSLLMVNSFFGDSHSINILGSSTVLMILFFSIISLITILRFFLISFSHR
jgi:hypothetical protein